MCGSTNWPYREPPEAYGLCKHGVWAEAFCAECCSPDTRAAALSDLIAGDADLIVPHTLADSDGDDGA